MYSDISEKWCSECDLIKGISEPLRIRELGLEKIDRSIPTQFKVVQYMTQTQGHVEKLYKDPGHFSYNRCSAIMTYDSNRVPLGNQAEKDSPQNYINANFIEICKHRLIATQGPKQNTLQNFWRMIEKHKVVSIFMLCERTEKDKEKCYMYWPTKEHPLKVGDYELTFSELEKEKHCKIRKMVLRNLETSEERPITQYQFMGWPDGDRPLSEHRKPLAKLLQILVNHLLNDDSTVVHCSAGVGRTGTFIAMAQIMMMIEKQQDFSIFECVRRLREQRWAMVYTASQYEYLYDFTEDLANRHFQPQKFEALDKESESDD